MIYIIIGKDTTTHNEWVMRETFEKSLDAATRCQELNTIAQVGGEAVYRVDTVEPSADKDATRLYADKLVAERVAKDTAEIKGEHRTRDFQVDELFGNQMGYVIPGAGRIFLCSECGSIVHGTSKHTKWHNKLLP